MFWNGVPGRGCSGMESQNILYLGLRSRTRTVIKGHAVHQNTINEMDKTYNVGYRYTYMITAKKRAIENIHFFFSDYLIIYFILKVWDNGSSYIQYNLILMTLNSYQQQCWFLYFFQLSYTQLNRCGFNWGISLTKSLW